MTLWFGLLVLWGALAVPAGLAGLLVGNPESAIFIIAPIVLLGLGVGLLKFEAAMSATDRAEITAAILDAVGGTLVRDQ